MNVINTDGWSDSEDKEYEMYPAEKRQLQEPDFPRAVKNLRKRTVAILKTEDIKMSILPPNELKIKPLAKKALRAP